MKKKRDKSFLILWIGNIVSFILPMTTVISSRFYKNTILVVDSGASVYQWQLRETNYLIIFIVWTLMFMQII